MICPQCEKKMVNPYAQKLAIGWAYICRPCHKKKRMDDYNTKRRAKELEKSEQILASIRKEQGQEKI